MNWTSGNPAVLDKSCYKKMRTCPAKYASNIVYYPKKRKPASSTMLRRCGSSSAMVWSDWWLEHKNGDSVQKNIPFHFEVILRWTRWTRRFGGVCFWILYAVNSSWDDPAFVKRRVSEMFWMWRLRPQQVAACTDGPDGVAWACHASARLVKPGPSLAVSPLRKKIHLFSWPRSVRRFILYSLYPYFEVFVLLAKFMG